VNVTVFRKLKECELMLYVYDWNTQKTQRFHHYHHRFHSQRAMTYRCVSLPASILLGPMLGKKQLLSRMENFHQYRPTSNRYPAEERFALCQSKTHIAPPSDALP